MRNRMRVLEKLGWIFMNNPNDESEWKAAKYYIASSGEILRKIGLKGKLEDLIPQLESYEARRKWDGQTLEPEQSYPNIKDNILP